MKIQSKFEFKINQYITLKLESGITNIYVSEEEFMQCKFLLLNIPIRKFDYLSNLDSIDEISERLDGSLEPIGGRKTKVVVPSETEFWGHCSNLQICSEHDYDTNLLHSNLAFPLLRRLTEVNDLQAKEVFKEEITKRLKSGYLPVIVYLAENGYFEQFNPDELSQIFGEIVFDYPSNLDFTNEYGVLKLLKDLFENCPSYLKPIIKPKLKEKIAKYLIYAVDESLHLYDRDLGDFSVEDYLDYLNDDEIEMCIKELKSKLSSEGIKNFKETGLFKGTRLMTLLLRLEQNIDEIRIIKRLEDVLNTNLHGIEHDDPQFSNDPLGYVLRDCKVIRLNLSYFKLKTVPKQVFELKSLERLNLSRTKITTLPKQINQLKSLKYLNLSRNKLTNLPESIGNLDQLKDLNVGYNLLKSLPNSIPNLKSLQTLILNHNEFKIFPNVIFRLNSLTYLSIGSLLEILPQNIGNLKYIESLDLERNLLKTLPESLGDLKQLRSLALSRNVLINLPESIGNLKNLEWLSLHHNNLEMLPETINGLLELKLLSLWKNPLKRLPNSIVDLKELNNFTLDHEMIENIPKSVLKKMENKISIFNKGNITRLKKSEIKIKKDNLKNSLKGF